MKPYYSKDGITIYHADCRDVIAGAADTTGVDLVLTDPPYSSGARRDAERQVRGSMLRGMDDEDWFSHDAMTSWGFTWFVRSVFTRLRAQLPEGAHVYSFIDWRQAPNLYGLLEASGYRVNHCLVWDKGSFGMGAFWRNQHEHIVFASNGGPADMRDRGMGSVLQHAPVRHDKRVHPTEKPVGLVRKILAAVPGRVVFDPFSGSGATLVAARDLGLQAFGCEIEEHFCEVAAKRLSEPSMFDAKAGSSTPSLFETGAAP